jgi:uncharacterized protein YjbJ (UPF0337 family)
VGDGTEDKTKGVMERTKGKGKEAAGKVTDNEDLEREGRTDQLKGDAHEAVGHVKDAGSKLKEGVHDVADND